MKNPEDVQKEIEQDITKNQILLYVKGNRSFPQCGFSKAVMDVFEHLGAPFETRDVLSDPNIRDGVKRFTNWPTIPQVFIAGKFVGGCDIIRDMFQSGELENLVKGLSQNPNRSEDVTTSG